MKQCMSMRPGKKLGRSMKNGACVCLAAVYGGGWGGGVGPTLTPARFIRVFAYNLAGRRRGGVGAASTPPRFIRVFAYNLTGRRRHPVWLFKNLKGRRCGVTARGQDMTPFSIVGQVSVQGVCSAGAGADKLVKGLRNQGQGF